MIWPIIVRNLVEYTLRLEDAEDAYLIDLPAEVILPNSSKSMGKVIQCQEYKGYHIGQMLPLRYSEDLAKVKYFFIHESTGRDAVVWDRGSQFINISWDYIHSIGEYEESGLL